MVKRVPDASAMFCAVNIGIRKAKATPTDVITIKRRLVVVQ